MSPFLPENYNLLSWEMLVGFVSIFLFVLLIPSLAIFFPLWNSYYLHVEPAGWVLFFNYLNCSASFVVFFPSNVWGIYLTLYFSYSTELFIVLILMSSFCLLNVTLRYHSFFTL